MKSTTASSTCCTPLFLYEEPHSTGLNALVTVPLRMQARSTSGVGGTSSVRYFSIAS